MPVKTVRSEKKLQPWKQPLNPRKCPSRTFSLKFSEWKVLVLVICAMKRIIRKKLKDETCVLPSKAEQFILREVQKAIYGPKLQSLQTGKQLPKDSTLLTLNPVLDQHGLLRVGGRLRHCKVANNFKQQFIIPKGHNVATHLVRHFYQRVFHQERKLTEGAICAAWFWVIRARHIVNSVIHSCVICRIVLKNDGWPTQR